MSAAVAAIVILPAQGARAADPASGARSADAAQGARAADTASGVPASGAMPGPVDLVGLDFQLINGNSDKCLAGSGDGRAVVQKRCVRTEAQRWRVAPVGTDLSFRVINVGTEKCLAGDDGRAVLAACTDTAERRWQLRDSKNDSYGQMRNVATGRCLTIAGGSEADGAAARQFTCDDKKSRRWTVRVTSVPFISMPIGPLQ